MRSRSLSSSIVLFSALLASCTTLSPTVQQADQYTDALLEKADDLRAQAKSPLPQLDMSSIQVQDGFYVGSISHKKSDGNLLPVEVEQGGVTLVSGQSADIYQIAQLVTDATNIPVIVSDDVTSSSSGNGSGSKSGGGSSAVGTMLSGFINTGVSAPAGGGNAAGGLASRNPLADKGKMRVDHSGPLSKFLDHVAGYYNLGWRFSGGTIHFFRNATRTYTVAALPTKITSQATLTSGLTGGSSGGSGGGTSGSANMNAAITTNIDFWGDFQNSIGTIIGSSGTYIVNQSAGTVTVTAPYDVLDDIGDYIEYVNKTLLRQVLVRVEIYSLTLDAESFLNFSPRAAWSDNNGTVGLFGGSPDSTNFHIDPSTGIAPGAIAPTAGQALVGTMASGTGSGLLTGVINGKWKGTGGAFNLGDLDNKATLVTSASLTTMSGQPVPLQVGNSQDYISQIQTTLSTMGTSQTSVTTSTVTSGLSLNLLPKVMDDGKVLIQYAVSLSDSPTFTKVTVGDGSIQELSINQKSFIQQALINNGATLVLAGFENILGIDDKAGVGKASFALLGGSYAVQKERTITVIALTPLVLDNEDTAARMQQQAKV